MVRIKVICGGCGIEYRDEHGNLRHMLKTSEDGPFDCDAAAAERLVSLGVAIYADKALTPVQEDVSVDQFPDVSKELLELSDHGQEEEILQEGRIEEKQLRMMKIQDLKDCARSMGLHTEGCVKKEDYVDLIMAAVQEENEEAPFLKAEIPV